MMYGHFAGPLGECHISSKSGSTVCTGSADLCNLQKALNAAALKLGVTGGQGESQIAVDCQIGPLTVQMAMNVAGQGSVQASSPDAVDLVNQVNAGTTPAAQVLSDGAARWTAMFAGIAGIPIPTTSSRDTQVAVANTGQDEDTGTVVTAAVGGGVSPIWWGIGAGAVLIGVVAAVAYQRRKSKTTIKYLPPPRHHRARHARRSRPEEIIIRRGRRPIDVRV